MDGDPGRGDGLGRRRGRGGRRAVQLCKTKTAAYNATPLREQQLAQFQMGKAKARVEASRDTLHRAASVCLRRRRAERHAASRPDAKIRLQLAVCFAAEACAEAVRFVNDVVGPPRSAWGSRSNVTSATPTRSCSTPPSPAPVTRRPDGLMFGLENDWVWLSF